LKRLITYVALFAFIASIISFGTAFAGNEQERLDEINRQIKQSQSQLNAGRQKVKELNSQIKNLESQINATEKEISNLENDIIATEKKIEAEKEKLAQKERELAAQNEGLSKRLRAMYKNGDIGMLQVLLGSESITDFMTNMDMVQRIFDYDVEVLKKLEEQHRLIEEKKKELERLQAQLKTQKQKKEDKQSDLQASRGKVADLKSQVEKDNKALEEMIDSLNAEADRLVEEIRKLQGDQAYIGGEFAWPSASSRRVTSEFGNRIHPILKVKKLHTGIDIGAPAGTEVLAANHGTVIKADWNNSYGNVVMIDHGGGIVTLYAHNSKLLVKTGDYVKKGQTIALVGSTGNSTGPHIHFEVRVNGQYQDPRKWL